MTTLMFSSLKAQHYAACYIEGLSDDEIEKDWEQVQRDLEAFYKLSMGIHEKETNGSDDHRTD